ncbi:Dihydrolipoyl dehydrogenase [Candidatus Arsenophonus lipoptenae]|uniref:Dihydrolipoyl dehydrogenase n=2 Tax=Morganellaceae TaxID=1903414 RepID=A0A120HPT8_9GAMM|nr:Dihydrolipoyl dehydrogenase [Candidatus Arsenophonus lipoptenae]
MSIEITTQVVVIGAGPAGYSSAFRCSDLGLQTILIERYSTLGGVCLNVGCIPSKALLHISKIIKEVQSLISHGIICGEHNIDINKVRLWTDKVISKLTIGLEVMAKNRNVKVINGIGKFIDDHTLIVDSEKERITIKFDNAIIAAGSRPIHLPFIPHNDPRIWDSTDAIKLREVPKYMLVIGGGIIGLEISSIYQALGSKIDIIEIFDQVIPAVDEDIIKVFTRQISKNFNLLLETKVTSVEVKQDGLYVTMEDKNGSIKKNFYDTILVATGRIPNSDLIDFGNLRIEVDNHGFINTDKQMRTNIQNIYAVGDIAGQPMLAHKGIHEGHVAAEVISGLKHYFDPKIIPSIAYTDPEIAWVGITEKIAKEKDINYEIASFPWTASGRAIASNYLDGITKLIFDKKTNRIIGGSVVGVNAGELLGEIGLAIEMGCDAQDIALTVHAHPTLYESIGMAAKIFEGSITDLLNPQVKNKLHF